MNISHKIRVKDVKFTPDSIIAVLADGREVSCPLDWFPRLANATQEQRNDYELICDNTAIHWETLDEDLSAEGFLSFSPPIAVAN